MTTITVQYDIKLGIYLEYYGILPQWYTDSNSKNVHFLLHDAQPISLTCKGIGGDIIHEGVN